MFGLLKRSNRQVKYLLIGLVIFWLLMNILFIIENRLNISPRPDNTFLSLLESNTQYTNGVVYATLYHDFRRRNVITTYALLNHAGLDAMRMTAWSGVYVTQQPDTFRTLADIEAEILQTQPYKLVDGDRTRFFFIQYQNESDVPIYMLRHLNDVYFVPEILMPEGIVGG